MKRLFLDLDICSSCPACVVECSYYYHPGNNGIDRVREVATYELVCRHCEYGTCVQACPVEALERDERGVLNRHSMRCIGCKSCAHACPFGTIYPELLPYKFSACDFCIDRVKEEAPLCVRSCPYGALRYEEVGEDVAEGIYHIGDRLAVRSHHWLRHGVEQGV